MNIHKRVIGSLMLLALAFGLTASQAAAEEVYKGAFDLPTAVYWGGAVLQPGQYTVSVNQEISTAPVLYLRGEGVSRAFFTAEVIPERTSHADHLKVQNIDGTYVVRALDAGILGKSFAFAAPKSANAR